MGVKRDFSRKPLEAVENNYVIPEPSKPVYLHTDSKYAAALGAAAVSTTTPSSYVPSVTSSVIPPYVSSLPTTYVPNYSYTNPISPSFYYPPAPAPISTTSNENLFTDPKLLELLRKDLSEINSRRTLSRQNTYESQLYQPPAYTPSTYFSPMHTFEQEHARVAESGSTGRTSLMNNLPHHQNRQSLIQPKMEVVKEVY